ncbi:MAG: allophanate hydrolase [Bacillota bacterium]
MTYFPNKLSITWIKQAYSANQITPAELLQEIIKRSEAVSDKNIWITPPSVEFSMPYIENLPKNKADFPLWGIPFAIKDNIDLANVATTAGCAEYAYTPEKSAFVVEKLIKAGAIPIGKTNLDQFATGLVGTRSPYGEVHNAHDAELISGGSSSGSAVSVALGLVSFALGTDTAGSGRVPAMLNTLVGFKPPLGSWSTSGVVPACASLDCVTVFASSLEETLLIDSVAKGFDADCAWSKFYEEKGKTAPKKVYLPKTQPRFFGRFEEIYKAKWENTVKRILSLGMEVEFIDYDMFEKAALILYEGAYVAERWEDLKDFVESNEGKTFPVTEQILRSGSKIENTAAKLFGNLHELQSYKQKTKVLLKDAVMIMPTAGGTFSRDEVREDPIKTNSLMGLYTNHCNLLDLFAIAVPENSKDKSNPFGITVFGLSDAENIVTQFCGEFLADERVNLAVCGIHKQGRALEYQLLELCGEFQKHTTTAKEYKLYQLATTPVKPGLFKTATGGEEIEIDIYSLPKSKLGIFMDNVSSPLNIGDITTKDGEIVKSFLCEPYALDGAKDITNQKKF